MPGKALNSTIVCPERSACGRGEITRCQDAGHNVVALENFCQEVRFVSRRAKFIPPLEVRGFLSP